MPPEIIKQKRMYKEHHSWKEFDKAVRQYFFSNFQNFYPKFVSTYIKW